MTAIRTTPATAKKMTKEVWFLSHEIQCRLPRAMKECILNAALRCRRNLPWLNKKLIQSMRRRNKLFEQAKISGNFSKYKAVRNQTLQQLRSSKRLYLAQLNPRDSKSFWKTVKFLNKNQNSIPTLSQGETIATTGSHNYINTPTWWCNEQAPVTVVGVCHVHL